MAPSARVADLSKVVGAGRHLLALITDVLDLSKIEAGRMDLHVESFDVAALIAGAVSTSQTLASARGNVVMAEGLAHLGTARGDQTKVQQVLLNLLSNACKFTSHGTVRVEAHREAGPGADWIVIDVIDTGIGMTLEQTGRIFHEFTQADASTTRRYGGTGLGLAISQRLCHLMGGSLTVDSVFGQGSTFTARIPAEMAIASAPPAVRRQFTPFDEAKTPFAAPLPAHQPDPGAGPTVLIIDDDAGARELMTRMLHKGGFRPVIASSAEAGLQLLREMTPDAVVLDVLLPDATGWSLLEEIKADPLLQRIPVVVLSVLENRGLSLALGAVDHIIKPVSADRLLTLLRSATAGFPRPTTTPRLDIVSAGARAGVSLETEER